MGYDLIMERAMNSCAAVERAMDSSAAVNRLMLQMLAWIAAQPRTYAEAMDAWRSSCPRHPIWDDALRDGFIYVDSTGRTMKDALVALTPRGSQVLQQAAAN
jgi:hypothetical protein